MKRATYLICAVLGAIAMGCATSNYERAQDTGASMAAFRNDIVNVKKATDTTMIALSQISQTANAGPQKAFKKFSDSLAKLDDATKTAKADAQDIKEKGADYFKQWQAEMATVKNSEIRALADQRRAKLQETFDKVRPLMEQTKADFGPFSSDVHDLQKFLSNDLTVEGVDSAKDLIKKTQEHGTAVQKSLDDLIAEMNTIAAAITPVKAK